MQPRLPFVLVLLVGWALLGCSPGEEHKQTFVDAGISFQYPEGWHVAGFSTTNLPHRLAVTSYPVPPGAVEGDCGGSAAIELLPQDGAMVLLIDYGERGTFPPRPPSLTMSAGDFAEYECFGPSTMFRFRLGRRDLQAHVAVGSEAGEETRERALAVLATVAITQKPIVLVPATHRDGDKVVSFLAGRAGFARVPLGLVRNLAMRNVALAAG